jgi:hypothetical protein
MPRHLRSRLALPLSAALLAAAPSAARAEPDLHRELGEKPSAEPSPSPSPLAAGYDPTLANAAAPAVIPSLFGPPAPVSRSWVPIVGYNPTYRFFAGGGFFFSHEPLRAGVHGVVTQDGVVQVMLSGRGVIARRWEWNAGLEVDHGFEPIYGVGSNTHVEDRVDIQMAKVLMSAELAYHPSPPLGVGPRVEVRWRRNEAPPSRLEPSMGRRENRFAAGLAQRLDYRNRDSGPSFGWYEEVRFMGSPQESSDSAGENGRSFAVLDIDLRFFQPMNKDVVFAVNLSAGTGIGQPSYLWAPRLGGTDQMRGYFENRFRGRNYYVEQTELRFPIWHPVSAATFLEFGEASPGDFQSPRVSGGWGLRIGLPPDYVSQLRIDWAFGEDQRGVFLDFGHAF